MDDDERALVLEVLKRHGAEVTSFQVLERGFAYRVEGEDRCVAYVDTGAAWVAAGSPIAPRGAWNELVARFVEDAKRAGRRACFFAVEDAFVSVPGVVSMQIGEQPWWIPAEWSATLRRSRSLREQLRRARAKGVRVREVPPEELRPGAALRREIERVMQAWLDTRKMPPMGFLTDLQPFDFPEERRYFVAERDGIVIGFLAAVPIFARNAWFCEDLLRTPAAPNGTTELLFDAAIRRADADGADGITLGLAALSGEVAAPFRAVRAVTRWLYDFEGVRRFKARLSPARWEPVFLAWPRGRSGAVAVLDSLAAFTFRGGAEPREEASMVRFGWRTLTRSRGLAWRMVLVAVVLGALVLAAVWSARGTQHGDHARAVHRVGLRDPRGLGSSGSGQWTRPRTRGALRRGQPTRTWLWISTTPGTVSEMASARSFIQRVRVDPESVTSPPETCTSMLLESTSRSRPSDSQTSS